jgi:hypothetical protein
VLNWLNRVKTQFGNPGQRFLISRPSKSLRTRPQLLRYYMMVGTSSTWKYGVDPTWVYG